MDIPVLTSSNRLVKDGHNSHPGRDVAADGNVRESGTSIVLGNVALNMIQVDVTGT